MNIVERFREHWKLSSEIMRMIVLHKKWWLMPIFFVFSLVSLLFVATGGGSILPAIYALF